MQKESKIRDPLILGNKTYHDITRDIAKPVEGKANKYWWILFGLSAALMLWGFACMAYTIGTGIKIISEKKAKKLKPDFFFVTPWGFIKEFIKREKNWLNNGGKFILPFPKMKIIGKK